MPKITKFSEPIVLAGLKEQFDDGDGLALFECIVLCHRDQIDLPAWAMDKIADASASIVEGLNLLGAGETKSVAADFQKAKKGFLEKIGLEIPKTNVLKKRASMRRNASIAELVARECRIAIGKELKFINVSAAFNKVADALEAKTVDSKTYPYIENDRDHSEPRSTVTRAWGLNQEKLRKFLWELHLHVTEITVDGLPHQLGPDWHRDELNGSLEWLLTDTE